MSTFFNELHAMVQAIGPVGIIVAPHGEKMSISVSPCPDDKNAKKTFREPLFVIGTAEEFDAEFISGLMNYRATVVGFSEQIAANVERLEQAGTAAVSAASKPAAKSGTRPAPAKAASTATPAAAASAKEGEAGTPARTPPKPVPVVAPQHDMFAESEPA